MDPEMDGGALDEALERFHRTGPEFDGWLSNHGPMAVEALARHGSGSEVPGWTDAYVRRLEDVPGSRHPIGEHWSEALGDAARLGDWLDFFQRATREAPWEEVLVRWWPQLLPGIAAGATHGVIRTGHAVLALRTEVTSPRVEELAHALGYWAARWQPVPALHLTGREPAGRLAATVPRVARQEGGIRERLAQLDSTPGWQEHAERLLPATEAEVPQAFDALVDAVVLAYPSIAHGEPTMLVHAATAPHAVVRALPVLPVELWTTSFGYAWSASAAVMAAYRPADDIRRPARTEDPAEAWELAVQDGSEHAIKLADTALDVFARTGDPDAMAAISAAVELGA